MKMKRIISVITLLLMVTTAFAQTDRSEVRKGNRQFRKEDYKEADISYRRALVKDSTSFAANYNLGNTLYMNGDSDGALKYYGAVKDNADMSGYGADLHYNSGNASVQKKDWKAAVDSYREALLRNPGDIDAKENYIYAKKKLEDQQNQDKNQDQNQDQNNDQNQNDDQNNDQNKDGNDNQDQNQDQNDNNDQNQNNNQDQQNQGQDQQQQQQQGQQPKITPQAAQQMLKAIQAKEKETQEKVNKEKAEALKSRQKEKNW